MGKSHASQYANFGSLLTYQSLLYLLFMTFMGLSSFHTLIDKNALRKDIIISWHNSISYIFLLSDALYINSININMGASYS